MPPSIVCYARIIFACNIIREHVLAYEIRSVLSSFHIYIMAAYSLLLLFTKQIAQLSTLSSSLLCQHNLLRPTYLIALFPCCSELQED